MPMPSPYQIVLSGQEQAALAARARSVRGPCRDRLLATIVLAGAPRSGRPPVFTAAAERMTKACPNAQLIHLPAHASWLDQAELYFSVVQRKALTPNDFTSLDQIRERLAAFEIRYNAITWTFTRTDLSDCYAASTPTTRPSPTPWQHDPRRPKSRTPKG